MADLMKLREEHARLVEIADRLGHIIRQPNPPAAADLFLLRRELSATLVGHLKAEDWVLYPRLLAYPDTLVAQTARAFSDEMGGLATDYCAYCDRWTASAIDRDWSGYCVETGAILVALVSRIKRENGELYPLLEALDRAA